MNTDRAFTVLELFLVAGMIAAVASVAMPVLDCLRLKINRAHATNSFAELARGVSDYADDHDSALPAAGEPRPSWESSQSPENAKAWYNAIPRRLGRKGVADFAGQPGTFYNKENLLFIPAARYPINKDELPLFAVSMNAELWAGNSGGPVRLRTMRHESRTVILHESGLPGEKPLPGRRALEYHGQSKSDAAHRRARYHGRVLVSFGDGRVELLEPRELVDLKPKPISADR